MLTRDSILAADDLKTETVDVPEWGDKVNVKTMSGAERDAWELESVSGDAEDDPESGTSAKAQNFRSRLLVRCLVDDTGKPIFTATDAAGLGGKSSLVISRLYKVASRLNGLGAEAESEAEKN